MKSSLPINSNEHRSYQIHRRQMWTQILLPIILAALVFIAVIVTTSIGALRGHGDVGRWAAISTIWLVLPVMFAGLIFLILLIVMIYLLSRVMGIIPLYSFKVQTVVYKIESVVKRFAEMLRKPILAIKELTRLVRAYIKNLRNENSG